MRPLMNSTPDFNESELWTVSDTLKQRYGHEVDIEIADAELRLDPHSSTLTSCPVLFWRDDKGTSFVISKLGDRRYRGQFFYRVHQQFGTGIDEFENLAECTVTLLQVQADHAAQQE